MQLASPFEARDHNMCSICIYAYDANWLESALCHPSDYLYTRRTPGMYAGVCCRLCFPKRTVQNEGGGGKAIVCLLL